MGGTSTIADYIGQWIRHFIKRGNFRQNRKTRDAANGVLVTALIPLSLLTEVTDILDGKSTEQARWIMSNALFDAKEGAMVYANAS